MTQDATARWMPIQVGPNLALRKRRGERVCVVERLPWELFEGEAIERQSQKNHSQSVARIAERGGYGACEAIAVIACVPWQKFCDDEEHAHRILYAMHCIFHRGQRVAEGRLNITSGTNSWQRKRSVARDA